MGVLAEMVFFGLRFFMSEMFLDMEVLAEMFFWGAEDFFMSEMFF